MTARPGIEPSGGLAACSASKAALAHLTRILDVELPPYRIRVSAVAPPLIDTPANRAFVPADIPAHAVSSEAIAAVIAFLVSDAAALVSGAMIRAYGTRPTAQALSPARAAVQSRAMAKAGRNQHIHGCRWKTGSAVLRSRESPGSGEAS